MYGGIAITKPLTSASTPSFRIMSTAAAAPGAGAAHVVGDEQLDLPSENPAGRVELRHRQFQTKPHLPVVGLNQLVLSLPIPARDERADAQRPGLDEGRERGVRRPRPPLRHPRRPWRRASLDG